MWTREELKERAKQVLRKYYWVAFLVTLVPGLLSGGVRGTGASGSGVNFRLNAGSWPGYYGQYGATQGFDNFDLSDPVLSAVVAVILFVIAALSAVIFVISAIGIAYQIFIGGPMDVGTKRYFLEARQDRSDLINLLYSFRNGRYMNAVKAIAWQMLFTFLWSLLFLIPGWIKGYSYSMIPYLMADNPGMDYKRAMKLSMAMTDGEKWNIFVLDLSFLGWALLCLVTCGIGFFFLNPYIQATKAELYVTLRQRALDRGLFAADEVGLA